MLHLTYRVWVGELTHGLLSTRSVDISMSKDSTQSNEWPSS